MKQNKELVFGTIVSYATVIVQILSTFIITPFLINALGDNNYGIYKIVTSVIAYVNILNFGFGNSLIRFLSELRAKNEGQEKENKLLSAIFLFNLLAVFVAAIVGVVIYWFIPSFFSESLSTVDLTLARKLFVILLIGTFATIINDVYVAYIYVHEKFIFTKLVDLLKCVLRVVLLCSILMHSSNAMFVAMIDTTLAVIVLLLNMYLCRHRLGLKIETVLFSVCGSKKDFIKPIIAYAFFFFINLLIDQLIWNTDSIIIGMRLGGVQTAIFSAGATVSTAFYSMSMLINNMVFPGIVKNVAIHKDGSYYTDVMISISRIQAFLALYIFIGYFLLGKAFVTNVWLGPDYELAWTTSIVVMFGTLFSSIASSGHLILRALNRQGFFLSVYFIIFFVNVIVSYLVVGRYGILGAAIATTVSYMVGMCCFIMPYYKIVIKIDIKRYLRSLIPIVICYAILAVVGKLIIDRMQLNSVIPIVCVGIIYTFLYVLLGFLFLLKNNEKEKILKLIKKRK